MPATPAHTSLLVVGAGPYGLAVAARALERGIDTTVVGRPMGFWTEHMPSGMHLRSGLDWHLDASGVHTFEAFAEERSISPDDVDPVPIAVFLDYASWFRASKHVAVAERRVARLERRDGGFLAVFDDGSGLSAERVVVAPGNCDFANLPSWAAELPAGIAHHTCDLVRFDEHCGARVLIVGGRQSAYEWAALLGENHAERVDIVHRHDVPRFERVSWRFVDPYIEATISTRGWWRSLAPSQQEGIARQFWEVGRLTLEWWLAPRLAGERFQRWPQRHVASCTARDDGTVEAVLSSGERLVVDRVVFATGYRTEIGRVAHLGPLLCDLETADGFPLLDEAFQTSVPGLYIPGFAATRDFGPFFGFTKGCPAAATLVVDSLLAGA